MFGGKRADSEGSWAQYEAQGVRNLVAASADDDESALRDELSRGRRLYRPEKLLLGDAFDVESGRPLRLKSGVGVYVTAAGDEYYRQRFGERTSDAPQSNLPRLRLRDGSYTEPRPGARIDVCTEAKSDHDG